MASLRQYVGENPRHVSWNNKNTEFEEGRQNMIGLSCMKAVCEYTHPRGGLPYGTDEDGRRKF